MSRFRPLPLSFYRRPAETVARDLLGRYLVRELDGERLVLRLVETEAYLGAPDRASHAWDGRRTPRNESLYLPGGHAYVYLIYGMHFCLNAVTGEADIGSAVLLRAGEPVEGEERMIGEPGLGRAAPPRRPRRRPGQALPGPGASAATSTASSSTEPPLYDHRGRAGRGGDRRAEPADRRRLRRGGRGLAAALLGAGEPACVEALAAD